MTFAFRRGFLKSAAASAVIAAAGLEQVPRAMAAENVQFAQDPANLRPGLEAAHVPRIVLEKAEAKDVAHGKTPAGDFYRVSVQARHEATRDHHISEMALFVNGENVAQFRMNPDRADASMPLVVAVERLKKGDEVMAVTSCNLHGKWGGKASL